ncbi:MAG: hypothetical protein Q8P60_10315 [Pseudorhodobacter sp.]|nr:hypothetical protein [Pseudorhodobacter sp.]
MTRLVRLLLVLPLLAACGIDGAPTPPAATPQPGMSLTGQAQIGVVVR